jgi:NTP pyrophosphatase (non-canonical NTP hydrolase)
MAKTDLTFSALSRANKRRCEGVFHPIDAWSMTDWMTAVAGEVGEAANLIKKARRAEGKEEAELLDYDLGLDFPYDNPDTDTDPARYITGREAIGYELADAVIYIDLLCQRLGIDLGEMVTRKFNIVSRRRQSITLLPEVSSPANDQDQHSGGAK